jgi:hypothetical protein
MDFSASVIIAVGKEICRYAFAKRGKEEVISDIRMLRFSRDGVMQVVQAVAESRSLRPEVERELLTSFNDKQWAVVEAVERLADDCPNISNKMRGELTEMAYAKRGVRRAVQDLVNSPGPANVNLSASDAANLLGEMRRLNSVIDELEDVLIHGRGHA